MAIEILLEPVLYRNNEDTTAMVVSDGVGVRCGGVWRWCGGRIHRKEEKVSMQHSWELRVSRYIQKYREKENSSESLNSSISANAMRS